MSKRKLTNNDKLNQVKVNKIFPKIDDLETAVDLLKTPNIEIKKETRKGRKTDSEIEAEKAEATGEAVLDNKTKAELIDMLFDENKDIELEKIIPKVMKMGKTISSLKGIRETMEDVLNIQQLADLVKVMRHTKNKDKEEVEDSDNNTNNNMDFTSMLPFLQKINGAGFDSGQIDPLMLSMMMSNNKGNNPLNQFFFMMSMANIIKNATNNNNESANNVKPNISGDIITKLYEEMKNLMSQQQQQPTLDPAYMMVLQLLNKNNTNSDTVEKVLGKMTEMMSTQQNNQLAQIMQLQNEKFERTIETLAGVLHTDPTKKLLDNFEIFNKLQGNSHSLTKDQMEYELQKEKIRLEEKRRRDLLEIEEREKERESVKSERLYGTAERVLNKIVGEGVGVLAKDIISARNSVKKDQPTKRYQITGEDLDNI